MKCFHCNRQSQACVNDVPLCSQHIYKVARLPSCSLFKCILMSDVKIDDGYYCFNHGKQLVQSIVDTFKESEADTETDLERAIRESIEGDDIGRSAVSNITEKQINDKTQILVVKHFKKDCSICQDVFAHGSKARLLPCSHLFHPECIDESFKRDFSCPTCRKKL